MDRGKKKYKREPMLTNLPSILVFKITKHLYAHSKSTKLQSIQVAYSSDRYTECQHLSKIAFGLTVHRTEFGQLHHYFGKT